MPTVREVFEDNKRHLSPVPPPEFTQTCAECFGPVDGYVRCPSCHKLFQGSGRRHSGQVIPMSIVKNPGAWYSRLKGYKGGMPEYRRVIAAVAWGFIAEHEDEIAAALGGAPDFIAVTPSKGRHVGEKHPLRETLELLKSPLHPIEEPVVYIGDGTSPRGEYMPSDFRTDTDVVARQRIMLLEDIWVSGRTCMGTAGAMIDAGAESVLIMPIGRMVRIPPVIVSEDHPFFRWIEEPYDLKRWPRTAP